MSDTNAVGSGIQGAVVGNAFDYKANLKAQTRKLNAEAEEIEVAIQSFKDRNPTK